jgi:Sulfotransferase family
MRRALPDFFLLGAAKSGTTSLWRYLNQHPQIFMSSVKEPKYFSLMGTELDYSGPGDENIKKGTVTTPEEYHQLFCDAPAGTVRGEASTIYLDDPVAASRIAQTIPEAKLLVVLRHPAERAYAAYLHLVRDGWECLDFEQALKAEKERRDSNYYLYWRYLERGFYGKALSAYYEHFPASQIQVHLYEELDNDTNGVLRKMFTFLDIKADVMIDSSARHNRSGIPKNALLSKTLIGASPLKQVLKKFIPENLGHRLVSRVQASNIERPSIPPKIRAELVDRYAQDIQMLAGLIDHDLSHWLEAR